MKLFLQKKDDPTGKKFQVVRVDKETNELVLKGEVSTFREPNDPERFKRLGYWLIKELEQGDEGYEGAKA